MSTRASDSSWVDVVWTSESDRVTEMTAVACETWGLVFWHQDGSTHAAVTGPESRTSVAPVPDDARFVGVQLAVGCALRAVPTAALVDGGVVLGDTTRRRFRLDGRRWEVPGPDDAEALVARLVRSGTVIRDPLVTEALRGGRPAIGERALQRRFRAATGFSHAGVRQIRRARTAAQRLVDGAGTDDVVAGLGFYDEPHLARVLRRYVGRTAADLRAGAGGAIALDSPQRSTA